MKLKLKVPFYARASIPTSLVVMLFGLDTGCIGPVTTMPSYISTFGSFSATVHGAIVSAALIPGAITALIAGALAHRFGHAKLIALGSLIHGIGAAIECGSVNLGNFVVGRLVKGIGTGLFLSNVFVQVSETSPARTRGVMTALPQFVSVFGVVMGYFICYATARMKPDSSASWRIPLAIDSGLGLLLSGTYWLTPASPRWLASRGRKDEALEVASRLDFEPAEREALVSTSFASDAQEEEPQAITFRQSLRLTLTEFRLAFSAPFRKRTMFGCFLMSMQQFSGIDGVLYYAPVLFAQAGLQGDQATFLASGVTALVIFAATVPATIFANSLGRRTTSIIGGLGITVLMLVMGSLYAANAVGAHSEAGKWIVMVCIYLFAMIYSGTWAVSFRTFLVEIMPRKTRSSASSLAQSCNWIANYIVAFITPIFVSKAPFGAYFLFAGCTIIATVFIMLFMVETKGYSLETIEQRYNESEFNGAGTTAVQWFNLKGLRHRTHDVVTA